MTRTATYARSLIASWTGYGASILVMFFLSPFVVHSLGKSTFGVWSLLMTLTGYLGLAEIGVRVSTGRFINYYMGRKDPARVDEVVSTSLAFYAIVSAVVLLAAVIIGHFFHQIFPKTDIAFVGSARIVLLLAAANILLGLWSSTFGQLLSANNRFDLTNLSTLVLLSVRAVGTVLVLKAGMGLVALSLVMVLSNAASLATMMTSWRARGVRVNLSPSHVKMERFREVFGFGIWSSVSNVSTYAIYYASATIIGIMLGMEAVANYALGLVLVDTAKDLLGFVVRVVTPDMQKHAAQGLENLRPLMVKTTNATMVLAVPLLCGLLTMGGDFLKQWLGHEFDPRMAQVLMIVTVAQFGALANFSAVSVLNALGHVRLLAMFYAMEAGLNVLLAIKFTGLLHWGLPGVALAMALPSLLISNVTMLIASCRKTGVRPLDYMKQTTFKWLAAALIYLPVCFTISRFMGGRGWGGFWSKVAVAAAAYVPVGLFVMVGYRNAADWLKGQRVARVARRQRALEESSV